MIIQLLSLRDYFSIKFYCSPSPATVGMTVPTDPADQAANEALARNQLNLNTEQPLTTIQIRLADGSNVRVQFNLTHTVRDIRRYIVT